MHVGPTGGFDFKLPVKGPAKNFFLKKTSAPFSCPLISFQAQCFDQPILQHARS